MELTENVMTNRDRLVVAVTRLLWACRLLPVVRLVGTACSPVRWYATSTLAALGSSCIVLLIAVNGLPGIRTCWVLACGLGAASSAAVMLLILVLLATLGTTSGCIAILASSGLLSRLIMARLVGVAILIQTVVVLLTLFLVSTFLSGGAVLGTPEVAGGCRWVGFVLGVHFRPGCGVVRFAMGSDVVSI